MRLRPDLLDDNSPAGLEVIQLTDEDVPSSHVYMEAQISTLDSRFLLLHRSAHAHGSDKDDPEHRYLVCDTENDCELAPLTSECGATAPSVSPEGESVYYFLNETETGGGALTLKRVGIDGQGRETVLRLDAPLPGTAFRPSRIYPLSTISSDGRKLALSAFMGDGETENAPYGLMVFDLRKATVDLVLSGPTWCNIHPQYCRSRDAERQRDILVQENHGNTHDAAGNITGRLTGGAGAEIHVIRDDGTDFRTMPWGRDGNEFCQGHQCWRGRSAWAITSTGTRSPAEQQLIESLACGHQGHIGLGTSRAVRNHLSRTFADPHPCFHHFGTDISGTRLVTDAGPFNTGGRLFLFEFGEPGQEAFAKCTHLLAPRSSCVKETHIHPFLSPDGSMAFFNSDETGVLQAYMVRGLP